MAITVQRTWANTFTGSTSPTLNLNLLNGNSTLVAILTKDDDVKPSSFPAGWVDEVGLNIGTAAYANIYTKTQEGGYFNNYYTWGHGSIGTTNFLNFVIGGANLDRVYVGGANSGWLWENHIKPGGSISEPSVYKTGFSGMGSQYRGYAFSADGTKIISADNTLDVLKELSLSTAWEVNTASFTANTFDFSSETSQVDGIQFKPDGLKVWLGDSAGDIHEYTLSTAFDISSTVTFVSTFSHGTASSLYNFAFSSDGTKLFCGMGASTQVKEYTLSTAWLISTATLTTTHTISGDGIVDTGSIVFKPDGTEFSVGKWDNANVMQRAVYSLSTAWDISGTSRAYVSIHDAKPPTNTTLLASGMWGGANNADYKFDISANGMFTAKSATPMFPGSYEEITSGIEFTNNSDFPTGITGAWVRTDGTQFYLMTNAGVVHQYTLSTAWDFASYSKDGTRAMWALGGFGIEFSCFSQDGTKVYTTSGSTGLWQYTLTTAWDLTGTVTYDGVLDFSTLGSFGNIYASLFSEDGLKVQILSTNSSGYLYQFSLSTANDLLSTVTYDQLNHLFGTGLYRRGINNTANGDRHIYSTGNTQRTYRKIGYPLADLNPTWTTDSEDSCLVIFELLGVDENTAYVHAIKDNGSTATPGTDANAALVDFLIGGFGADQYQTPNTLDSHLTTSHYDLGTGGSGGCTLRVGSTTHTPKASIPAMSHSMGSSDQCAGFYIGFSAQIIHDATGHFISPNSLIDGEGASESLGNLGAGHFISPNSLIDGLGAVLPITYGTGHFISPNSYINTSLVLNIDNVEFTGLGLAYDVVDLGIEKDFTVFQLIADLSPDVEIPLIRFTLRRISTGSAEGLNGNVTFHAFVPKGFDAILNQLVGADVTLNVQSAYQSNTVFTSVANVVISRVKFMVDKDSIYGELETNYPLRPESIFTLPNDEIIYSSPNQYRTIMHNDIYPGMFVNARGFEQEIVQITMYAEYNNGLMEIITR